MLVGCVNTQTSYKFYIIVSSFMKFRCFLLSFFWQSFKNIYKRGVWLPEIIWFPKTDSKIWPFLSGQIQYKARNFLKKVQSHSFESKAFLVIQNPIQLEVKKSEFSDIRFNIQVAVNSLFKTFLNYIIYIKFPKESKN